jgi:DNA-binding MarR family transcriptional regulator
MGYKVGRGKIVGELEDRSLIVLNPRRSKLRKDFFLAMDDGFMILCDLDLTKHEYRTILFILGDMNFENYFYGTQTYIAEKLKIAQPDVSKTLKLLESKGLIFKENVNGRRSIRVSAVVAWKGKANAEFSRRFAIDSEHIA